MTEDQYFAIGLKMLSVLQANITVIVKYIFVLCTNREVVISKIYVIQLFFSSFFLIDGLLISQFAHRREFPR